MAIQPAFAARPASSSRTGDLFDAIARRAGTETASLAAQCAGHRAGQTGLLRVAWDKGDRSILADPSLRGITIGWGLHHNAADELFAAIEGTGFHTRIILERLERAGVAIDRVINTGGIPRRNGQLNRAYASILGKEVLVPANDATGLGSIVFALLAAGECNSIAAVQTRLRQDYIRYEPDPSACAEYDVLYGKFTRLYQSDELRDLARETAARR